MLYKVHKSKQNLPWGPFIGYMNLCSVNIGSPEIVKALHSANFIPENWFPQEEILVYQTHNYDGTASYAVFRSRPRTQLFLIRPLIDREEIVEKIDSIDQHMKYLTISQATPTITQSLTGNILLPIHQQIFIRNNG